MIVIIIISIISIIIITTSIIIISVAWIIRLSFISAIQWAFVRQKLQSIHSGTSLPPVIRTPLRSSKPSEWNEYERMVSPGYCVAEKKKKHDDSEWLVPLRPDATSQWTEASSSTPCRCWLQTDKYSNLLFGCLLQKYYFPFLSGS